MASLILASSSAIRATILSNAGIPFQTVKTGVDETKIKEAGIARGRPINDIALDLAKAKAMAVELSDDNLCLGSDQILEFEGAIYDKPSSRKEAFQRLKNLSGKKHTLVNATVIISKTGVVFEHVARSDLYMRKLTDTDLAAYLDAVDDTILKSVGGYHVEGVGVRLFEKIEGDYFAVLGLALSPILPTLRAHSIIGF